MAEPKWFHDPERSEAIVARNIKPGQDFRLADEADMAVVEDVMTEVVTALERIIDAHPELNLKRLLLLFTNLPILVAERELAGDRASYALALSALGLTIPAICDDRLRRMGVARE